MSYPPPPGLKSSSQSSTPQPHPSLPARPPPSAAGSSKSSFSASQIGAQGATGFNDGRQASGNNGFTTFKPRISNGGGQDWQMSQASITAGPAPPSNFPIPSTGYGGGGYGQQAYQYQAPQQQPQYFAQPEPQGYPQPTPPQIQNPFAPPSQNGRNGYDNASYDPEMEAQIAQWQSAYSGREEQQTPRHSGATGAASAGGANAVALGNRPLSNQEVASAAKGDSGVANVIAGADGKQKTVVRSGGGQSWQDSSLLEWDPAHFRLFVGNLAGEVTDDSLLKAFVKYESVQKARVVRDKRTTKSKGYGFVSFSDGDEYFQAVKDMQGKYIGSHPVLLKRSTTEIKPTTPADRNKKKQHGKGGGGSGAHANTGAGVKKAAKTKGGLKILG